MYHEFHDQLNLSAEQDRLLEYHSLLNLFNVLELQLSGLAVEISDPDIQRFSRFCLDILMELPQIDVRERIPEMLDNCRVMRTKLLQLREAYPHLKKILNGLIATTHVGHDRLMEFKDSRFEWKPAAKDTVRTVLRTFLEATSTVSGDRFSFSYSPEPPRPKTYWIDFQIESESDEILVPSAINDTIRDLVSNSRKYSEPGSSIRVRLVPFESRGIKLSVLDEGIGIPGEDLPLIVRYGYRAVNTMDRRTMGAGIGLTKAYCLCRKFKGTMSVESEPGSGTKITLTLFQPE